MDRVIIRIVLLLVAVFALSSRASAQKITNVDANQEGKNIAITYDLSEMANISVFVSFNGGKTKIAIPAEYTTGDIGNRVSAGSNKKILWHVLEQHQNQNFQGEGMSFIVYGRPCMYFFAIANGGYSLDSGPVLGITLGQMGSIGWYVKGITTPSVAKEVQFVGDENGAVSGIYPAYSGIGNKFKAYGVAGLNIRMGAPIYLCAGAGYGIKTFDWETVDGKWVRYSPDSYSGLAIDAGLLAKFNKIAVSIGATYMGGSIDICGGIGWVF